MEKSSKCKVEESFSNVNRNFEADQGKFLTVSAQNKKKFKTKD